MPVPVARPGTPYAAVHLADCDIHPVATTIPMLHVEHYVELLVNGTKHQSTGKVALGPLYPCLVRVYRMGPTLLAWKCASLAVLSIGVSLQISSTSPHQHCHAVDVLGLQLSGLDPLCSARNSPGVDLPRMTSWMFTSGVGILEFLILSTASTSL